MDALKSPLFKDPYDQMTQLYYEKLLKAIPQKYLDTNATNTIKFVYTAMHGVGYPFVERAFETVHLKPVHAVVEQRDPNPEFPTVKFPNPEEGKSCLELSMQLADSLDTNVILANDPDADRLACSEKDPK